MYEHESFNQNAVNMRGAMNSLYRTGLRLQIAKLILFLYDDYLFV